MDLTDWIDRLAVDGPRLADAVRAAGWTATVPGTDWDARALLIHTGAVHRWATDAVRSPRPSRPADGIPSFHGDVPDDDRLDWFTRGHAALIDTLRAAPADVDAFTFLPADSALQFWARRQAHETAIHRADAEAAAGAPVTPFAADHAQDGIDELAGWGRARAFAADRTATLALAASDGPSWRVTFGGERNVIERADGPADATVSGTSSELYLWVWNRPSTAVVSGDESVAALWNRVRIT